MHAVLSVLPLPSLALGLFLLWIAERSTHGWLHVVLISLALSLWITGAVALAFRWSQHHLERRKADGASAWCHGLCYLGLLIYWASLPSHGWFLEGTTATLLQILWPALIAAGLLPLVAIEMALYSMRQTPTIELWRIFLAARSAIIVLFGLFAFAGLNYAANQWQRKIDVSYFKATQAGASTLALVRQTSQPIHLSLFFPSGNEVLEQVRSYALELVAANPLVQLTVVDHALAPEQAKSLEVRANGWLAVAVEQRHETLQIGLDVEEARRNLKRLDGEIQQRLLRLLRPARYAYLVSGHMERDYTPTQQDPRPALSTLRQVFEAQGFTVKRLGMAEGLGDKVPQDATVVLLIGPLQGLLPAEVQALMTYYQQGGALMLAIDPSSAQSAVRTSLAPLLQLLGVEISTAAVANERYLFRIPGSTESRSNLVTNRTSHHAVIHTLEQSSGRMPVLLVQSSHLQKAEQAQGQTIQFPLLAMVQSWADTIPNGLRDEKVEPFSSFHLMAVVEQTAPPSVQPGQEGNTLLAASPQKETSALPSPDPSATSQSPRPIQLGRAALFGSSEVMSDLLLQNAGNLYLLYDTVRWLARDEAIAGAIESEEDVEIMMRKENDTIWFYGVSFIMPLLVFIAGFATMRRQRRQRKE